MADRKEKLAEWLATREKEKAGVKAKPKIKFGKPTVLGHGDGAKSRSLAQDVLRETFSFQQKRTPFSRSTVSRTAEVDENAGSCANVKLFVGSTPCTSKFNQLKFQSELESEHMTPARLEFSEKPAAGQMSCQKLRAKLQAHSIRKQKRHIKREVKAEVPSKPEPSFQPAPPMKSNLEQVRFNNLRKTVLSQVAATKLLMKNCQFKEAKGDLGLLVEEIPEAEQIAEFWVTLAQIEQRLKGRNAALMVYALAFDKLKNKQEQAAIVQDACRQLILQNFRVDGYFSLEEVFPHASARVTLKVQPCEDEMEQSDNEFPEEAPEIEEVEEDLQSYLYPNPTPQKALEGPLRVKMENAVEVNEPFCKPEIPPKTQGGLGSIVVLAAVKAKGKLKQELGTDKVLTPVRRAARHHAATVDLTQTGYAYTPNRALTFGDGDKRTPRPLVSHSKARASRKVSVTPEAIRQELERLLIG